MQAREDKMTVLKRRCEDPVFIVGSSRSGTTWLQSLLCLDEEFFSCPETKFFQQVLDPHKTLSQYQKFPQKAKIISDAVLPQIIKNSFIHLADIGFISLSDEARGLLKNLATSGELDPAIYLNILIYDCLGQGSAAKRWIEKTPKHIFFLKEIFRYFPRAKVICVYRDPVDVIMSTNRNFRVPFLEGLRDVTNSYAAFEKFMELNPDKADRVMILRYEDMKEDIKVVNDCLSFLGRGPISEDTLKRGAGESFKVIYGKTNMASYQPQMSSASQADNSASRGDDVRLKLEMICAFFAGRFRGRMAGYLSKYQLEKERRLPITAGLFFFVSEAIKFLSFHIRLNLSYLKSLLLAPSK